MKVAPLALAGLCAGLLAGCGAQVTLQGHTVSEGRARVARPAQAAGEHAVASVREVTVTLTPGVRQQVRDDRNFDADVLREMLEKELDGRGLLDGKGNGPVVEILVDELSVQPTSELVQLGSRPAAGALSGLVRVLGVDLVERDSFKIAAEAPVSLPREGDENSATLRPLFRSYAVQVADALAGKPGAVSERPAPPDAGAR